MARKRLGQTQLLIARDDDLKWMRGQVARLKLNNVTDEHLENFLTHFGSRETAVKAIHSVHKGETFHE